MFKYAMLPLTSTSQSHTDAVFGSLALLTGASSCGSDLTPQKAQTGRGTWDKLALKA